MKRPDLSVTIPYRVEFRKRRCRKVESRIYWDDGAIVVREADRLDAPVAYAVTAKSGTQPNYDIRLFDGKLWWPLFVGHKPLTAETYAASLDDAAGCFLRSLHLSPSTLSAPRGFTTAHLNADVTISQIFMSTRESAWNGANHTAARTLFVEVLVYQEGGKPGFFGRPSDGEIGSSLSFRIGGLANGKRHPADRWHLGVPATRRRSARVGATCSTSSGSTNFQTTDTTAGLRRTSRMRYSSFANYRTVRRPCSSALTRARGLFSRCQDGCPATTDRRWRLT